MRVTIGGRRWRAGTMGWRRQKIVRTSLVVGVLLLALISVLSMCDTAGPADTAADGEQSKASAHPRFEVPAAYDDARGWDLPEASEEYAVARTTGSIATLEDAGDDRVRVRAVDITSGSRRWSGDAWKPQSDGWTKPRLLTVAKGGREFFVVWAYGEIRKSVLSDAKKAVALDIYDAAYGTRQHVEVPWTEAPEVAGAGPGILVGRGSDHAAVVDPVTGAVTQTAAKDLKYPKGCSSCRHETEVRGLTSHGLLVRGAKEFWLRGDWYARNHAPKGTDAATGVPTSVTTDRILAKWQKKPASSKKKEEKEDKGGKKGKKGEGGEKGDKGDKEQQDPKDLETWAVHDAATGKVLASVDCHKPAIDPGRYPELVISFSGRYAVAGPLAFDLKEHKGHCYDESDRPQTGAADEVDPEDPAADQGPRPLALTTVTDDGTAYGTTSAHANSGRPIQVTVATATAKSLSPTVHLPIADLGGYGIFPYNDTKDVDHLVGYPRREPSD